MCDFSPHKSTIKEVNPPHPTVHSKETLPQDSFLSLHGAVSKVDPLFTFKPVLNVCVSGLRHLSVSELTETLEEVETAIRRYSEELIQALALRDELDYEKEVLKSHVSDE